jgi:hypothetical protein
MQFTGIKYKETKKKKHSKIHVKDPNNLHDWLLSILGYYYDYTITSKIKRRSDLLINLLNALPKSILSHFLS